MRIRKILPLVLLAVASVFLLTSCDALLDAIFSNNTLTVTVKTLYTYGYYSGDYVTVSLTGPTALGSTNVPFSYYDGQFTYWQITLPKLADGTYTVGVFYSVTGTSKFALVDLGGSSSHSQSVILQYP